MFNDTCNDDDADAYAGNVDDDDDVGGDDDVEDEDDDNSKRNSNDNDATAADYHYTVALEAEYHLLSLAGTRNQQ